MSFGRVSFFSNLKYIIKVMAYPPFVVKFPEHDVGLSQEPGGGRRPLLGQG